MTITTLPITPGKHNSFVTMFGLIIADVFSKLTNYPFKLVLNVIHSFCSFENKIEKYLDQLTRFRINPSLVVYDNSIEYQKYINFIVNDLFDKRFLKIKTMKIVSCSCGVVELPLSVCQTLSKQQRFKYIQNGKCLNCSGKLTTKEESILELQLPETNLEMNLSSLYQFRFKDIYKLLGNRPLIISRNHRNGLNVFLSDQSFKLDTDFCWMIYLLYLNDNEFCLISGSDTINHSAKAIKLLSIYKPEAKVNLVIYPLLKPIDSIIQLSNFTIDEYLNNCGTPQCSRTFLLLGTQWRQPTVSLKASDLHLVKKSVYPNRRFVSVGEDGLIDFPQIYNVFNSQEILKLLKLMRGYQTELNGAQIKLKEVLFG